MIILAIGWLACGVVAWVRPHRNGKSMLLESFEDLDKASRQKGILGVLVGLAIIACALFLLIPLGPISLFFSWLSDQD